MQNLLEWLVINLILNVFQAMPNGGRLTIGAWRDGQIIEIGATVQGYRSLFKIFDPFFTTRNDSRRSGLGLSVSHSIVRQHLGGGVTSAYCRSNGTDFSSCTFLVARELSLTAETEKASELRPASAIRQSH